MAERQLSSSDASVSTVNTFNTANTGDAERPTWASPIHQGIQDATRSSHRRRSLECSATVITIPEAELVRGSSGSYMVYLVNIASGLKQWSVRRRYTDFNFLDQQLKKIVPKEEMPVVPPKRFIGSSTDKRFVEERRRDLEKWLQILVSIPSAWARTEFVRFLDNESNSMMFIWNFEKMRKVQETLSTMTLENKQETAKLTSELVTAREQVATLQDRIARMEMIFLQQATGAAGEVNKLPSRALHSISRCPEDAPLYLSSYVSETSSQQDMNSQQDIKSTPPLSPIDFGEDTRLSTEAEPDEEDDDREVHKIIRNQSVEFNVSTPLAVTHSSLSLDQTGGALQDEAPPMAPEQVLKVLAMTREQPITSQTLKVGGIHRSHSAQEFRSISATLLLQDAMRISNQMLEEKYVINAGKAQSESEGLTHAQQQVDVNTQDNCSSEVDETPGSVDATTVAAAASVDVLDEEQSASIQLLSSSYKVVNNESAGGSTPSTSCSRFQSKWMNTLSDRIDELVGAISPTASDLILRRRIFQYVQGVVNVTLGGTQVFPMGSFVSSTFLPDSDVDLTAFMANDEKDEEPWFVKVNESLCFTSMGRGDPSEYSRSSDRMNVSNVSFVNAEVKIIKCMINNVNVDISVNRISSIYSQTMIEQLDEYVGDNHLFKRSILLIKAWCLYESPRHSKGSGGICGAREGGLKTWGIVTLIIWIFNHKGHHISHPVQALGYFLGYFASFQWTKYAITVSGPVSVADLSELSPEEFEAANFRREYNSFSSDCFFPEEELTRNRNRYENSRSVSYSCFQGTDKLAPKVPSDGVSSSTDANLSESTADMAPVHARVNKKKANVATVWPAASAFGGESNDVYRRSVVNIIDCIQVKNNLGRSVSVMNYNSLITVMQQGYQSFQEMCAACKNCSVSSKDVAATGLEDVPIVTQFFLNTTTMLREFGRGGNVRYERSGASSAVQEDVLASQLDVLQVAMRHGEFILSSAIHYEELIRAIVGILQKRGPMPVGEIGKGLQELTCCDSISRRIKLLCGGLKKAIELHGVGRIVIGADHPFNPCVYLVEDESDKDEMRDSQDEGKSGSSASPNLTSTALSTSLTLSSMVLSPPRPADARFTPLGNQGKSSSFKESNKNKTNDGFTPLTKSQSFKEKRNGYDGNGDYNTVASPSRHSGNGQPVRNQGKKNSQSRNQGGGQMSNANYPPYGYAQQSSNGVALDQFGNPCPYWPNSSAGGVYMMYPNMSAQGQQMSQQQIAQMYQQQQQMYYQQGKGQLMTSQAIAIPADTIATPMPDAFPPLPPPTDSGSGE